MTIEKLKKKYEERILGILSSIAIICRDAGFVVDDPFDMTCDEDYRWYLIIHRHREDEEHQLAVPGTTIAVKQDVDISFTIAEAKYWDDPENKFGVNFMLDIVENGGTILGGHCPYNYTEEVWVDRRDEAAVEARFQLMESPDLDSIVELLKEE